MLDEKDADENDAPVPANNWSMKNVGNAIKSFWVVARDEHILKDYKGKDVEWERMK